MKARLRFSQTVFVTLAFIGAAAGSCLLANAPAAMGWDKVVALVVSTVLLVLGPFLVGRAFDKDTRACLRAATATRFVVVSVEKVSNPKNMWRGHHVALAGVDQPGLEAGITTDQLPDDFAFEKKEVVGLPTVRGEYLVLGLTETRVLSARPSAKRPVYLSVNGW